MKKILLSTLAIALFAFAKQTNAQIINTIAGDGTVGYSGDGGVATSAAISCAEGITIDAEGNLYIADTFNNVIRKVNTSGIITTIAGIVTAGYSGDGGAATNAELYWPEEMTVDAVGNIYFADVNNDRVRKINTSGIISTIAGNGTYGYTGNGGLAVNAELNIPTGVAVDMAGNVYIADDWNNCIRKVNTSGIISTIAGNGTAGYTGDGSAAIFAELNSPNALSVDISGNLYLVDGSNNCIRKINTSGIITTIAGNGTSGYSGDGGVATAAELTPNGLAIDAAGNIYISDNSNNRIRKVNTSGIITTIVGNGTYGYTGDGGLAVNAELMGPWAIAVGNSNNLFLSQFDIIDSSGGVIREVTGLTGIPENNFSNTTINVFPNPSNGIFNVVQKNNFQKSSLEIYNVLGEKIISTTLNASQTPIDLSNKAKGVYFYKVVSQDGKNISEGKLVLTDN